MRHKSFAYKVRYVLGKFQLVQDYGAQLPPLPVCEFAAQCLSMYLVPNCYVQQVQLYIDHDKRGYNITLVRLRDDIYRVNMIQY